MISEYMKQQRAERAAQSQFKPGAIVALVNHHWDRRIDGKRRVAKVHVNGNFVLASRNEGGPAETRIWRPNADGTTAQPTGKAMGFRHSEHLEIWTADHDAEIASAKTMRDRAERSGIVRRKIEEARTLDEYTLRALEAALGLSTAAPNVPEAD